MINPGYAGTSKLLSMDLISRFQWTGIPGAPRTFSFSVQSPLKNKHLGLGMFAYNDELGPSVNYGAMAAFAYRVQFKSTQLSFGLQAGFTYMDIQWSKLDPKDPSDILLAGDITNKMVPDADFGIYYYGDKFYSGFSITHLFQNQIMISSSPPDGSTGFTKLMRNYYGMGGVVVELTDNLVLLPSILLKYMNDTPLQADLSAAFQINNLITLGASYRTNSALGLMAGLTVGKGFSIGYSYDIWFNYLKAYNSGSHEIRLTYELDPFNRNRMLTPRYF